MASPERASLLLAGLAAWSELESAVGSVVAATLRDDARTVEELRARAHDLLDEHIDAKIAGVTAIRRDVAKQFRD